MPSGRGCSVKFNDALQRLLQEMELALEDLKRLRGDITSVSELEKDSIRLRALRDAAFVAIQSAIDVGARIISQMGWPKPEVYRQIFYILREKGVIPSDVGEKMMDLAAFRNVLVHLYWRLQMERLFRFLKEDYRYISEFRRAILEFIQRHEI